MKTFCGCGKFMRDYGGVSGEAIEECSYCSMNGGDYRKSPHWNHRKDKEDMRRVKEAQAFNHGMADVVPLEKTRQGKKKRHASR